MLAEAQKKGGICAFIDAEHALDPVYAGKLGVKVADLLISQPDDGEQALEIADTLVRSGAVDVLVVDSVAALTPKAELEGEMGDMQPGMQARLMSKALRKLTASISKSKCMVIFINQIRMKIGIMFGNPETTTGGNALKFYASVRLDIRRIGQIKEREEVVGNQTRVKVVKNKVAPPFKQVEFDIMYGEGISKTGELVDLGVKAGIVEKSGAWFSYNGERIGQGRENTKAFLKEHPKVADQIEKAIRQNAGLIVDKMLQAAPEGDEATEAEEGPGRARRGRRGRHRRRQEGAARRADGLLSFRPRASPESRNPGLQFLTCRGWVPDILPSAQNSGMTADFCVCGQPWAARLEVATANFLHMTEDRARLAGARVEHHDWRQSGPRDVSRLLPQERPRGRAVCAAGAAQRPDLDVHLGRHGAVQERLHRPGDAPLCARVLLAEMRARGRQAQRPRQRRLHGAASHLLRDARQLLLRRLLQGEGHPAGVGAGHQGVRPRRQAAAGHHLP